MCNVISGPRARASRTTPAATEGPAQHLMSHGVLLGHLRERLQRNVAGQVVLSESAWRDGTTHLVCPRWNSCSGWLCWCHGQVFRLVHQVSPSDGDFANRIARSVLPRRTGGAPIRDFRMQPLSCDLVSGFG